MHLPKGQTIFLTDDELRLAAWTRGTLPDPTLEDVARELFTWRYPQSTITDPLFEGDLDDARRLVLKLRLMGSMVSARSTPADGIPPDWRVPANDDIREARWLDAWFALQLANVTALHLYGKPLSALKPLLRADIRSFADSYTEDAATRYAAILNAVEGGR